MIHTIQADFYRLFRSKGFWITELVLFALMLMGATFRSYRTAHIRQHKYKRRKPNYQQGMGWYTSPY